MKKFAVVYDTETTGLPLYREPSDDPRQPHIVQLAACLVELESRKICSTIDVIVKPNGWTIPEEISKIHGITDEMAHDLGIPESLAVEMLLDLRADRMRIAHNELFDARIVRIACKRHFDEHQVEVWAAGAAFCTATAATSILKIPPTEKMVAAGFRKHKTPNLTEAYKHFTGKDLQGAHSALVDVHACLEVFYGLDDLTRQELAA